VETTRAWLETIRKETDKHREGRAGKQETRQGLQHKTGNTQILTLVNTGAYHGGQRRVQTGLCLAVVGIAVLVAAAVVDKTDLEVHPTLQPAGSETAIDGSC